MNKVWKFHNDVDTDQIIASQYLLLPDIEAMKQYTFESLDPDFAKKAQPGDLIVAGENFGCGSSREQSLHRHSFMTILQMFLMKFLLKSLKGIVLLR